MTTTANLVSVTVLTLASRFTMPCKERRACHIFFMKETEALDKLTGLSKVTELVVK